MKCLHQLENLALQNITEVVPHGDGDIFYKKLFLNDVDVERNLSIDVEPAIQHAANSPEAGVVLYDPEVVVEPEERLGLDLELEIAAVIADLPEESDDEDVALLDPVEEESENAVRMLRIMRTMAGTIMF